jgi:SHS2 domain-containing protein
VPYELAGWGSDLAIAVSGPDPAACCAAAVQGLAASFTRADPEVARQLVPVEVEGDTPADLLAGVMEEAIVRLDARGEVALDLTDVAIEGRRLRGRFEVAALGDVDVTDAVPKAVTWHDLRLERTPDGWAGHVVVDL